MATSQYFIPKDLVDELTKFRQSTLYMLIASYIEDAFEWFTYSYQVELGIYSTLELAVMEYLRFYGVVDPSRLLEQEGEYVRENMEKVHLNSYDGKKWTYIPLILRSSNPWDRQYVNHMPYYIKEMRMNYPYDSHILDKTLASYIILDGKLVKMHEKPNFRTISGLKDFITENPRIIDPTFVPPTLPALNQFDFSRFHTLQN